ncbi:MAG: methylenetetrahydrofolate reductase C-terminal domain-containing protein [Deltaproteobacteria bacterium]|nr:methylenetetrahydrofolate reductase C-terminal domain-containing protein [Deltaproteobacteria bacterium]MBW1793191.1 methylenetetrahydrofolate reductase C-terminal domain-containing protein [Deltaproteobacteria bacterium]MBW2331436.1 methylenetetrahydrofolate reductase C-terminal domain-containing protein [Deltaproteobacteria bacterium]
MIVAKRKPFEEIKELVSGSKKLLILGCGTCVAVCLAGGEKEVAILASQLKMALTLENQDVEVDELTIERQCDREFIEEANTRVNVDDYDIILSTACGAGVQLVSDVFDHKVVLPALNTTFIGVAEGPGIWTERCRSCSDCVLADTGGICPVTMCAKGLVNGPCGGARKGKCEVDPEKDCAWTLIYNRLEKLGRLDRMKQILPPKRYSVQQYPAKIIHEAYRRRYE